MAAEQNIPIWPGSSSFFPGDTPFGFFDNDLTFQTDADKFAIYASRKLGYPIVDIELQDINFYACFEEAVNEYGSQIHQFKIRENYYSLEGSTTGSNLNNTVVNFNLGPLVRLSQTYGVEGGSGGNTLLRTGSIDITRGVQNYDLTSFVSSSVGGRPIEIKKLHHYPPSAMVRYFDPFAGTGTGLQSILETFGFGNYSPGINFMLMPIYFDILKVQAIEFNDQIRKSAYSFNFTGQNQLRIFPIPEREFTLYFDYIIVDERNDATQKDANGNVDKSLISDYSNVPYTNITYSTVNSPGKQWIFRYGAALAKEMLGNVRGKYNTVPIPNDSVTLDGDALRNQAQAEKDKLIEELRGNLEDISRTKQLEKQKLEAEYMSDNLKNVPFAGIYIF